MSVAVEAQTDFTALLEAAAAFDNAHVTFGGTAKLPKTFEVVWVLPVRGFQREPGEQFDIVAFDLAARFEVFRTGENSGDEADAQRWALIDAADAELKRANFLNYRTNGGRLFVPEQSLDHYDKGWVASSTVEFGVQIRQRA